MVGKALRRKNPCCASFMTHGRLPSSLQYQISILHACFSWMTAYKALLSGRDPSASPSPPYSNCPASWNYDRIHSFMNQHASHYASAGVSVKARKSSWPVWGSSSWHLVFANLE